MPGRVPSTILLALLTSGCPSLSALQTPETIGRGQIQLAAAPGVGVYERIDETDILPTTEFGVRYGVLDELDLSLKIYAVGLEFGAKWMFLDTESFDAAIAPSVAGVFASTGDESAGALYTHLSLLFGAHLSDVFTIGFGPRFFYGLLLTDVASSTVDGIDGAFGGLYLGIPIRMGRFTIAPEINAYSDLTGFAPGSFNVLLVSGGVTFLFDFFREDESSVPYVPPGYQR